MKILAHVVLFTAAVAATATATLTDELQRRVTAGATRFSDGSEFLLRSLTKTDMCLSDGDSNSATDNTKFTYAKCDGTKAGQRFKYVVTGSTHRLESAAKAGLCAARRSGLVYRACANSVTELELEYDATTYQIKFTASDQSIDCLDDGGEWGTGTTGTIAMRNCNAGSNNQRFVPEDPAATILGEVFARPKPVVFEICSTQMDTYCLADVSTVDIKVPYTTYPLKMLQVADYPYETASWFVYIPVDKTIRSYEKHTECITAIPGATWILATCDDDNNDQKFAYNDYTELFSGWEPRNKCLQPASWDAAHKTITSATCSFSSSSSALRQKVALKIVEGQSPNKPCPKLRLRSLRR